MTMTLGSDIAQSIDAALEGGVLEQITKAFAGVETNAQHVDNGGVGLFDMVLGGDLEKQSGQGMGM